MTSTPLAPVASSDDDAMPRGTSVVIPAWNDSHRLAPTLTSLLSTLDRTGAPFEIIVVADGCSDGTPDLVRAFQRDDLRVLEFPTRLGKGGAIVEGFWQARFDRVGFLDADSPVAPGEVLELIGRLDEFDGAIASRWVAGRKPRFHDSTRRNLLSIGWSTLARALFLTKVRDAQCGAKFFRTRPLRRILRRVTIRSWAFDLDLLYHWEKSGFTCDEVATVWKDDPDSKLVVGQALPLMLCSLLGIRLINSPIGKWVPARGRHKLRVTLGHLLYGFAASVRDGPPITPGADRPTDQSV